MAKEVKLVLTAEDNISDVIKKVSDYLGDSGLGQSLTAVSTSFIAIKEATEVVIGAFQKVNEVMQEGINDAANAEMVNKRLAMSMASVGQYTMDNYLAINEWSDALEASTGVAAEETKTLVGLGLQMGLTAEQSRKAAQAALDLSTATGQSLDGSFRALSMTLQGSSGKLEKMIPELANLTAEQLKNGDAIDLIAAKYEGFSGGAANSYIGAQKRIDNSIGDVKEAFGRLIAQNPAYIASMNAKADAIKAVADKLDDMATWALQNGEAIKMMAGSLAAATTIVVGFTQAQNIATASGWAWNTVTGATTALQKGLQIQTATTTASITAQQTVEKISTAIKAAFNTQTIAQALAEKQLQVSLVASLAIQKSKQAVETAMITIKNLMTGATIKNTASEAANAVQVALSNGLQKTSTAITAGLLAVKNALTLSNIRNTIAMAANAVASGAMSLATGALTVVLSAATIAQNALNFALTANPIGLVVVAVAGLTYGLYKLWQNIDLVTGAIKMGLGKALEWVMIPLSTLLEGVGQLVGIFNADWGAAIARTTKSMNDYAKNLQASGQAQMDLARKAKDGGKEMDTAALQAARATEGLKNKISENTQQLLQMKAAYSKAMGSAKEAFDALGDLMPRMSLELFNQDAATWKKSIEDLQKQAGELKMRLSLQPQDGSAKKELEAINQQLRFAEEANQALKIKSAQATRGALIKEEEIRLAQVKDKEVSAANEIMMMRMDYAKQSRDRQIAMEEERIMKSRGLASLDAQAGLTVREQALANANQREMAAFKAQLEMQKSMAISIESQKQLELANLKAQALGTNSKAGMEAANDVELIQAQQKEAQLAMMRDQGMINEQTFQDQLTQMRLEAVTNRTQMEVALNEQRIQMLGQSPEALQLQLENSRLQTEAEMLLLQEKYAAQQVTDEEFQAASLAKSEEFLVRQNEIKEAYLQKDVEKNQKLRDAWGTTLAQIRLEQERHGQIMGTIQGIYNSEQMKGLQTGLGNAASLMQSSNAQQFKIGQGAAIAQAAINIPLSAINAYTSMSAIPIVGPALGVAAAAAAVAAGMMNIQKIKSQRPPGSQAHGGIDEIPKSMNNSTFLLKAGERVVQPDQNKELGMAIEKINNGGMGGHTVNLTVNGNANDSDTIEKIKKAVMDGIREASERGVPVISSRGIAQG